MKTAILARHGESEYSVRGLMNGDPAVACGLTPAGIEQARKLGEALRGLDVGLLVTSAFQRARETAGEALRGREVPELVLAELGDPRYGRFEGMHLDDYRAWAASSPSSAVPGDGGESRATIVERYARAYRTLLARPEETILVVAHSLPIAYVLAAREGRHPGPRVPLVEYATAYPFTADELASAVAKLEEWLAAPTF
jgi:broad specificity phosphatase PhoE